ncbi:MAG: FAD/NAD-binding family oxidoreductase [Desulfovibrionaceae bacterium]|jgi:predicted ferric reductase|nr:FAD/NAD-binding family oxidoreductase [Desulfovibrionaceae bacterium]
MSDDTKHWRLVKTIAENEQITSVVIAPPEGEAAATAERMRHRKPGQFASLRVMTNTGWSEPHPFTISCDTDSEEVCFTIKKSGEFTASLRDLAPGTPVRCEGPFGTFCADISEHHDVVLIAGGVGITPFLSVLRNFRVHESGHRVTLFWSNRTLADAFAADELAEMTRGLDLVVVHCITREDPPASSTPRVHFEKGRFGRQLLQKYAPNPSAAFYLCGPPAMQEAVLQELSSCGIAPDAVQKEAFVYGGNRGGGDKSGSGSGRKNGASGPAGGGGSAA